MNNVMQLPRCSSFSEHTHTHTDTHTGCLDVLIHMLTLISQTACQRGKPHTPRRGGKETEQGGEKEIKKQGRIVGSRQSEKKIKREVQRKRV